jgi:hypothetical protein
MGSPHYPLSLLGIRDDGLEVFAKLLLKFVEIFLEDDQLMRGRTEPPEE